MTETTSKNFQQWTGDGVTTVFSPSNVNIQNESDLAVYVDDTLQTITADYTVGIVAEVATVTFLSAPSGAEKVTIVRQEPLEQNMDLTTINTFRAEGFEGALDSIVRQIYRVWHKLTRSLTLPDSNIDGSGQFDARSNRIGNVGDPTEDQDAITKAFAENRYALQSSGGGDMFKAAYDTNSDGKVDAADTVPWSGITGLPATFAPASHTHTASDVTGLAAVATSGSMSDMAEAANAKVMTAAERAAIAANTAKTTNATHTGDVTGSGALTIVNGAVTAAKTSAGVQASLALADSATQPGNLAPVATSGDYAHLINKPNIPAVSDAAYGAGWNGSSDAPTKNAIYDKIETLGGGGGASIEVEDEGSSLTTAVTKLNFVGSGVTAIESSNEVTVTVAGGAAPVDSVNGQTGAVVLDPDDLDDASTTNKFATAAELAKIGFVSVTQSVDLDQMETDIAALSDGMTYNGDWDASAGTFPAGANRGGFYYVSVAGTVDGIEFSVGDNLVAKVDSASTTVYAANWSKHDQTDAVSAVVGLTGSISKSALLVALNVEEDADVTDTANVTAAGALMDSELASIASVKALNQGVATGDSPTFVQPTVKAVTETRFVVTGTTPTIDPANGGIQTWTLSGDSTPEDGLGDGEAVTLHIDDGAAHTITWSSLVNNWIGGSAPTLPTSGYAVVEVWKVNSTVNAAYLGDLS